MPDRNGKIFYTSITSLSHISKVTGIVTAIPHVLQVHGFYYDTAEKVIRFDFVVSFDAQNRHQVYEEVVGAVQKAYPDFTLQVAMDTDFSEE